MQRVTVAGFSVLGVLLATLGVAHAAERLPALSAKRTDVTVSGISSGGYMAGQYHVAYSQSVSGVGIIAGGPYGCAQNSVMTALGACVKGGIDVAPLVAAAQVAAEKGTVDALDGLKADRVWLLHGSEDKAVQGSVVTAARAFYTSLGVVAAGIRYVDDVPVTHGLPTRAVGAECTKTGRPYLNACNYDAAGEMLGWLRGKLKQPAAPRGKLLSFDQSEFGDAELNDTGLVYVPASCEKAGSCQVHVFFHGCDQSAELVGDAVARGAGFNEWADTNALIVLYPQAKGSRLAPMNPLGCWDWWGYTGKDYATRQGKQIKAVHAMIDRLGAARP